MLDFVYLLLRILLGSKRTGTNITCWPVKYMCWRVLTIGSNLAPGLTILIALHVQTTGVKIRHQVVGASRTLVHIHVPSYSMVLATCIRQGCHCRLGHKIRK